MNNAVVQRTLRRLLPRHTRGRKGYDKLKLLLWLLYRQCMRCTYRDLESMTGIHHTTFIKFRKRLMARAWFEKAFEGLSGTLACRLPAITAILDSSFVRTYSGHAEEGSAYCGYTAAGGVQLPPLP